MAVIAKSLVTRTQLHYRCRASPGRCMSGSRLRPAASRAQSTRRRYRWTCRARAGCSSRLDHHCISHVSHAHIKASLRLKTSLPLSLSMSIRIGNALLIGSLRMTRADFQALATRGCLKPGLTLMRSHGRTRARSPARGRRYPPRGRCPSTRGRTPCPSPGRVRSPDQFSRAQRPGKPAR